MKVAVALMIIDEKTPRKNLLMQSQTKQVSLPAVALTKKLGKVNTVIIALLTRMRKRTPN